MRSGRRWIVALAVVLIGGSVLIVATRGGATRCPDAAVGVAEVPAVFASPQAPVVRTDLELSRLVTAVEHSGLGQVLGAIGFGQTPYLRTAGLPDGFATWTRDNAVIGFRSRSGVVRWGLRQSADPHAFAVVGATFVNLDLRPRAPLRAVAYEAASGVVAWCADLGHPARVGDPLTVAAGSSDSTWIVSAGPTLTHLDAHGRALARARVGDIDRGTFVKQIGRLLVVGGRAASLLTAPESRFPLPHGAAVAGLDASTLRRRWTWGAGLATHVLGESAGLVMVEVATPAGLSLVALDLAGHERWRTVLAAGTTADMVLLKSWSTVLVRSDRGITALDARTGTLRWTRTLGAAPFPDGFDLSAQPLVGQEVLLGTRSALVVVDVEGRITRYGLPSGTDFWPDAIAISGRAAVLETGAGAVLVALRPQV